MLIWILLEFMLIDPALQAKQPETQTFNVTTTGSTFKTLKGKESSLYDLPTKIDEDEFLHEVGLFMLDVMNQSVDPCENFYEYACGNWTNSSRVPEKYRHFDLMSAMRQQADALVIDFLKKDINSSKTIHLDGESKAKLFFQSCLKSGNNLVRGIKLLKEELNIIFGKDKPHPANEWVRLNFLSPYNIFPLLPVTLKHHKEQDKYDIYIRLPQRPLYRLLMEGNIEEFRHLVEKNEKEMDLLLEFERNLTTNIFAKRRNERLHLLSFLMKYRTEPINWYVVFTTIFNTTLNNDWYVSNDVANFTKLDKFLSMTNPSLLKEYIKSVTLAKFFKIWRKKLANDPQREEVCRIHTENYFTLALIPWLVETLYSTELREDTAKVADAIRKQYISTLESTEWLDDHTRSHMISKLLAMDVIIGYHDEFKHRAVINEWYSGVTMTNNWFTNVMNLEAHNARRFLNSVATSAMLPDLVPYTTNGYYSLEFNTVFTAMGTMQMPLYHHSFPLSLKYASFGMLFAHEMSHAFDIDGYNISFNGYSGIPWSEEALHHYREIYDCLQSHYKKFSHKGIRMNTITTFSENIADNIGGHISFHTYKNSIRQGEGKLKPLPGVTFTNDELYFIKLTQTWCAGYDDTTKIISLKNDQHAVENFRALGVLRNMPEFSEVFKCKLGSYMNPLRKCVLF